MACTVCGKVDNGLVVCDGKLKGKVCPAKYCFDCAGISSAPPGEWYCKGCKGKRHSVPSTPSSQTDAKRAHVVSPTLAEKARAALAKDKLPMFPSGQSIASASGSSSSFGFSKAFSLVAAKLDQIDQKLDNVVTSDQHLAVKSDLVANFETHLAELRAAFEKLEEENKALRSRVDELGRKLKALSTSGGSNGDPDVAFKRINFIGLPLVDPEARVKFVKHWCSSYFGSFTCSVGNVFRGPAHKRVLTAIAYADFADNDVRNLVLNKVKSEQPACKYLGSTVAVKPALSQYVRERIWPLNTAYDLIKKHSASSGKQVTKTKGKDATVSVGGVLAFTQSGSSGLGSFSDAFTDLSLPGK